jgi:hypothetical protein
MGIRGEIFSTALQMKNRTYFFNVKENRLGDLYLNLVESKNEEGGGFERQSLVIFADELQDFLGAFDDSLKQLEKAVREKRKNSVFRREGTVPSRERGSSNGDRSGFRREGVGPSGDRGGFHGNSGGSGGERGGFRGGSGGTGGERGGFRGGSGGSGRERGSDGGRQQFYAKKTDRDGGRAPFHGKARPEAQAGEETLTRDGKLSGKGKNIVIRKKRDRE